MGREHLHLACRACAELHARAAVLVASDPLLDDPAVFFEARQKLVATARRILELHVENRRIEIRVVDASDFDQRVPEAAESSIELDDNLGDGHALRTNRPD